MIEKMLTVQNELGLHARAAGKLVHCAMSFQCDITAIKGNKDYNMKRIMNVLLMGCVCGEQLLLRFDGPDEAAAASAVEELFLRRFDEPN